MAQSDVRVNITTWFDGKGLTQSEREFRRAYAMQERAAKEMAATEAQVAAARREALNSAANTMLGLGAAMTALAGLAVAKFAQFDQAMSNVAATGADAKNSLDALKDAALEAGARTAYSATEAANGIEELAKAGMSVTDILAGGLNGALDLAASGQLEVAAAAELTATTLTQFGLAGDKAAHVADLLAAGASKAQGDVADMGLALSYVGVTAAQLGVSVEETAGALAFLASNGILAEKAGTGLRGVLMALTAPSAKAADTMREFGINVFDAAGNFVGLESVAGQLQDKLGGLDEATRSAALGQIFGNEQISVARVLYQGGADAVREWTAAVDDQGFAARTAGDRMDNLKGDLEQLSGSWETFLIKMGEGANGPLRNMVQGITGVINALGDMPPAAQTALLAIVGGGGLALLGAGGMIKLTTAINQARVAMQALGWTARGVSAATLGIGAVLAIATAAFLKFNEAQQVAAQRADDYAATLDAETAALTDNTAALAANNLEKAGALEAARRLGIDSGLVIDAALGEAGALETLNKQLDSYVGTADMAADVREAMFSDRDAVERAVGLEAKALEAAAEATERRTEAVESSSYAQREAAKAAEDTTAAYEDETESIKGLIAILDALNGANQSREQAEINWQKQLAETAKAVTENGKTLDITTEAGRNNRQSMLDMAEAAADLAKKRLEQTGNEDQFRQTLDQAREALVNQGKQFGLTQEDAEEYADFLLTGIPDDVETTITADTEPARRTASSFISEFTGKIIPMSIALTTPRYNRENIPGTPEWKRAMGIEFADGGIVRQFASGGFENHTAQIAPAGAWRVWAEPETGGEAYIPLSPAKRARSLDVWEETGRILGAFEKAGRGGGVSVQVGDLYAQDPEAAIGKLMARVHDAAMVNGLNGIAAGVA